LVKLNNSNKIVHGLWIGSELSVIELTCIKSFLNNKYEFYLWLYEPIKTKLPAEVIIKDASEIISREFVFAYKNTNQYGHGKGSYAGFSDIFRYKLLYEHGGWWTDMDVICLKALDFTDEYVFRDHHDFPVIGNIMKCPKGSELMKACYEEALQNVTSENTDWNLPIKILNKQIELHNLTEHIKNFTNTDDWRFVRSFIIKDIKPPNNWYAIHLLNEEWRRNKIRKNGIGKNSFLGKQILKYYPDYQKQFKLSSYLCNYISVLNRKTIRLKDAIIKFFWFWSDIFWKIVRGVQRRVFGIRK
jgi:hypothetical protein